MLLDRFQRTLRLSQRPRGAEDKFRDFLMYAFGVRVSDYERMDKELQAAINDKYAYVFLRSPLDERVRHFLTSPRRPLFCHAPGCEWRESELTAFGILVRRCVRCEHYQVRSAYGTAASAWQEIGRADYEFLVLRDETHRAQWDAAPHIAAGTLNFDTRALSSAVSAVSAVSSSANGDNAVVAAQSEFDTAPRRPRDSGS